MNLDELREKTLPLAEWPAECRLPNEDMLVNEFRSAVHRRMFELVDFAERFGRDLSADERAEYDRLQREFDLFDVTATA